VSRPATPSAKPGTGSNPDRRRRAAPETRETGPISARPEAAPAFHVSGSGCFPAALPSDESTPTAPTAAGQRPPTRPVETFRFSWHSNSSHAVKSVNRRQFLTDSIAVVKVEHQPIDGCRIPLACQIAVLCRAWASQSESNRLKATENDPNRIKAAPTGWASSNQNRVRPVSRKQFPCLNQLAHLNDDHPKTLPSLLDSGNPTNVAMEIVPPMQRAPRIRRACQNAGMTDPIDGLPWGVWHNRRKIDVPRVGGNGGTGNDC